MFVKEKERTLIRSSSPSEIESGALSSRTDTVEDIVSVGPYELVEDGKEDMRYQLTVLVSASRASTVTVSASASGAATGLGTGLAMVKVAKVAAMTVKTVVNCIFMELL